MIIDLDFDKKYPDNSDLYRLYLLLDNYELFRKYFGTNKITKVLEIKKEFGARSSQTGSKEISYVRRVKELRKPKIYCEESRGTRKTRYKKSRGEVDSIWYGNLV